MGRKIFTTTTESKILGPEEVRRRVTPSLNKGLLFGSLVVNLKICLVNLGEVKLKSLINFF